MSEESSNDNNISCDEVPGRVEARLCQSCLKIGKSVNAHAFCDICKEVQCVDCIDGHKKFAVLAGHTSTKVTDKGHQRLPELTVKTWDMCATHGKPIEYFCKDDNQIICSKCAVIGNHKRCHNVEEISSAASGADEKLKEIRNKFLNLGNETKLLINQFEEEKNAMCNQVEQLPLTAHKTKEQIDRRFKYTSTKLTKEATAIKNKQISKINEKEELCKDIYEESEKSIKILTDVTESGVIENQFIAKKKLERTRKKISETCKSISNNEAVNILLEFEDSLNLLEKTGQSPGTLKINQMRNSQVITEYRSVNMKVLMSTMLVKSDDEEEDPFYSGIDFFQDGRLAVVDNKNKKIKILNLHFKTLNCSDVLTYHPQDIVVISNEEIATTARVERKIDIFNVSSSNKITLVRTIHSSAQLQSISLGDNDDFLVGHCDDTVPVRSISKNGEENDFNVSLPSRLCYKDGIACLWIGNCRKLVICDRYEHAVFIYDTELNTKVVVKDENIREPFGVAHGPFDSVFVCCHIENGSIVQISSTGRILSMHKLDIGCPFSMGVSKDYRRLAVFSFRDITRKLYLLKIML